MFADIRVGYIIIPEDLVTTFEVAQRHLGLVVTITMQAALAEFIGTGSYLAHVRRTTRLYRARRDRLLQALAVEVGNRLATDVPAGGMQLLARCKTSTNDRALSARLLDAGVITRPLSSMNFHNTREKGLFLGFAAWTPTQIRESLVKLASALKHGGKNLNYGRQSR